MNKRSLNAIFVSLLCALMIVANDRSASAQSDNTLSPAAVAGIWTSRDVSYAPWTFVLRSDGNTLTGVISQGRYNSSRTRATTLTPPTEIYDGTIRGNTISFKCQSPGSADRTITFTGQIDGDEITFTRTVEIRPGGDPGDDGIYGLSGAPHFVARRASGRGQQGERGPVTATLLARPSPLASPRRVTVGAATEAARLQSWVQPEYPPLARQAGIEGDVVLRTVIGTEGRVRELQPISGDPLLVKAAMDAVLQWRYQPTVLGGAPVEVATTIVVTFPPGSAPPHRKYVQVDPATGDLLISYPPGSGEVEPSRWVLRNHTAPIVHVAVQRIGSGFSYEYSLQNGSSASQEILGFTLRLPDSTVVDSWQDPEGWAHPRGVTLPSGKTISPVYPVTWLAKPTSDPDPWFLQPGGNAVTFGLGSPARPGFVDSFYDGFGPGDPTESMPEEVAAEVEPFMRPEGASQHRVVLGPVFAPDTPRNAMAEQLLDSTQKLIDAGNLNPNSPFLKEALEALRRAKLPERFENEPRGELENELLLAMRLDLQ